MNKRMIATGDKNEVKCYRRGDVVIAWRWDNVRKRYVPSSWPIAEWPEMAEKADKQAQQEAQS